MYRFRLTMTLALAGLALVACRAQATPTPVPLVPTQAFPTHTAAAVTPTNVAAPSVTPPPPTSTFTPAPPAATPTATVPPTPDPNEGVGDVVFRDNLDGTSSWYWTFEDDTASFSISSTDRQLNAVAKQSGSWRFTISPDTVKVGQQQIRVSAHTLICADADEYALLFRGADDNYNFYAFKLRCDGAARLELLQGADVTVLVDWTPSPAIQPGPNADNALLVWAAKDQMRFYVNDQYLFSAQDATLAEGFYGFYLYDRTNGNMSVSWKGLEAKSVAVP